MMVNKSDLEGANKSKVISAFQNDIEDCNKLKNAIEEFVNGTSDKLKGESYDSVRKYLSNYINVINTRISVANAIIDIITSANNSLIAYMEDEPVLITEEIPAINSRINYLKSAIEPDEYQISKLQRKKEKLDGLQGADNKAYGILNSTEGEINKLKSSIDSITGISFKG